MIGRVSLFLVAVPFAALAAAALLLLTEPLAGGGEGQEGSGSVLVARLGDEPTGDASSGAMVSRAASGRPERPVPTVTLSVNENVVPGRTGAADTASPDQGDLPEDPPTAPATEQRATRLRGQIRSASGEPLEAPRVRVRERRNVHAPLGPTFPFGPWREVAVVNGGEFVLEAGPDRFVEVEVTAEGQETLRREMVPNGQVEFVLRQPLALEGRVVVASSGLPVFGGEVTVTQASGVRRVLTDREGGYRIEGLANEFALVEIDHRLYRPQLTGLSEPLHARAGAVLRRDFRLEPGLQLSGQVHLPWDVSDPSSFQTAAQVVRVELHDLSLGARAGVQEFRGHPYGFAFHSLRPDGHYQLRGYIGTALRGVRTIEMRPNLPPVHLDLRGQWELSGQMTDEQGLPIADMVIEARPDPVPANSDKKVFTARTGRDGYFLLNDLPDGIELDLLAHHDPPQGGPRYALTSLGRANASLISRNVGKSVPLGATIEGVLLGGVSEAVTGALLRVQVALADRSHTLFTSIGPDGAFRLAGLPPGPAHIAFVIEGGQTAGVGGPLLLVPGETRTLHATLEQ